MTELVLRRAGAAWQQIRALDPVWMLVVLIPLLVVIMDLQQAERILGKAASAFAGTSPYIAIAILLIAGLKATGAEGVVSAAFEGKETKMIVMAALIGGLAPFCSCEVIPFVAALLAARTPLSAVMAFWLASPLMDPPTFSITAGVLGIEYAVAKTVTAVSLGLIGGFAVKSMVAAGAFKDVLKDYKISGCGCGPNPMNGKPVWLFWQEPDRRILFGRTALEQALFLGKWLALAYLLEGLLIVYVPAEMIGTIVGGDGIGPIIIGAFVGAPAYLNGYAAPAMIDALMKGGGMSPGAAMSFMVAGAVSSIPAMAAVFALVRIPVFLTYLGMGIGGAILSGMLFALVMGAH